MISGIEIIIKNIFFGRIYLTYSEILAARILSQTVRAPQRTIFFVILMISAVFIVC